MTRDEEKIYLEKRKKSQELVAVKTEEVKILLRGLKLHEVSSVLTNVQDEMRKQESILIFS